MHIHNKNKYILTLGKETTQGLGNTTLTADTKCPISITQARKRFRLTLHYNGSNSFLFINAAKIYQFEVKDSEIKIYALRLGNISNNFATKKMEKTGLKGIVKFFLLILIILILTIF